MKKSLRTSALLLLLAAAARPALAQTEPVLQPGQVSADDTLQAQQQLLRADSLVAEPAFSPDSAKLVWRQTPPEMRDLVADRIGCYESEMPLVFNNTVMAFVNYFTVRNRAYTQRVLERQNLYFPLFEKYLAKYHLPQDLKYLAVVESALLPQARSRVGAVGLWQFMGPTAGDLRLRRDEFIDERMNPEKSTEAACKFLRDLHRYFGDWELALAAYNYGSGNVNKAIRRAGGQRNFWAIYKYLPKETRDYVPTFTAILYTLNYAKEHNLHDAALHYRYPEPTDTLLISGRSLDLYKLAKSVGLDSTAILAHNPELRKHYLPEYFQNYPLQVPVCVRTELAVQDRTALLDFCKVTLPPPAPLTPVSPLLPPPDSTQAAVAATAPEKPRYRRARHTVRRGETVASLAARYEVDPSQIRRWNKLRRGQNLTPHQQIFVYVPVDAESVSTVAAAARPSVPTQLPAVATASKAAKETAPEKAKTPLPAVVEDASPAVSQSAPPIAAKKPTTKITRQPRPTEPAEKQPEVVANLQPVASSSDDSLPTEYVVRKGDYLTKIAREQNVSVGQLTSWNKLESKQVVPGQKLTLRAPADMPAGAEPRPEVAQAVQTPAKRSTHSALPTPRVHLVQPGDTLYNISRRYQGVTVDKLRKLNNLTSDEVKPGQKLIVQG
ncbi:LysM peptidoglycan-binding domain-containing protein [Hymenobacter lutimineralis]|uniref:LysM peptidoglycan-binding domain-containing protein n=1 Tax=Hymenobacter lutimineralis TaxID=2606448 RepID=A0A5D6VDR5_9BACT|nr:LysM peptidoglycan-binding domain-containing protein [Hymenobacter lutimineralis]TYZ13427.1 LysM peptidoglycan-binding domain-containing protein [Hymenobacter lutimineralis]